MLKIYWNLAPLIFRISQSQFWCQKLISLNTYHFFGPKWSQNEKCSEFTDVPNAHSIFQICKSGFWRQKWFFWNIYQLPGQINSKIKIALKCLFDISSIPILTTGSDKSFSEQLLHVMPKLDSKLEFQSQL